jgi:hypothetical protein
MGVGGSRSTTLIFMLRLNKLWSTPTFKGEADEITIVFGVEGNAEEDWIIPSP